MDNSLLLQTFKTLGLQKSINQQSATIIGNILNSQYDAVAIASKELQVLFVSKKYEAITGFKAEEVIGKKLSEIKRIIMTGFQPSLEVLATKSSCSIAYKTFAGNEVLITANPVFDDFGEIDFIFSNIRDVSDLDRLREESQSSLQERIKYEKENHELKEILSLYENFITQSNQMKKVAKKALLAARTVATILITGESGVGKGILAKFIHNSSNRCKKPFIQVNCSAIPETLFESELFGYEEGAFSGARRNGKPGLIELAHEGTLLLDEIGDMPLSVQAKLLNFLQEKYFYRIGGIKKVNVDVRVIAATNIDLEENVKNKYFREDLYYRLNVIPLEIPPLRERQEDIIPMINEFLNQFNQKYAKEKKITFGAKSTLLSYTWPGNVRELQNTIERLVILTEEEQITTKNINNCLTKTEQNTVSDICINNLIPLPEAYRQIERKLLELATQKFTSSRQIAKALGTSHPTISKKLKLHGIRINK